MVYRIRAHHGIVTMPRSMESICTQSFLSAILSISHMSRPEKMKPIRYPPVVAYG